MKWLRRFWATVHPEEFEVQLHVDSPEGIVYSFAPIMATDLTEAQMAAHGLRQDNRWAGDDRWPLVTIRDSSGKRYPEVEA